MRDSSDTRVDDGDEPVQILDQRIDQTGSATVVMMVQPVRDEFEHAADGGQRQSDSPALFSLGMADTFTWLNSRLAAQCAGSGCRTENMVSMLADSNALFTQLEINLNATFGALGLPIGPRER